MKDQTKTAKTNKKAAPKADEGGVKPKQALSAYMFFMTEQFSIQKKSNPDMKMVEIGKVNSQKWGTLSDKQKEKYIKLNEKDKVRYEKEMKQYEKQGWFINSDGVNSKCLTKSGRVLDFEANTVLPKKVKSSFMFFHAEYFQKNKNAETKISVTDMSKKIGAEWGTMTSKQKLKYENLSKKDETRYNNQIKELKDNGFFIMEDGSKSSEHQKKIKVKRDKK